MCNEPLRTSDFDYWLPPELIAQEPAEPRDSARLMVLYRGERRVEERVFRDLPELLRPGDLLVMNDTRVMAARLFGERVDTGGRVEVLLVRRLEPRAWVVLMRPLRQALPGRRFVFAGRHGPLGATVRSRGFGEAVLEFDREPDPASEGQVPLPPYIRRFRGDPERYQTVYARDARSAAAPTAGLHFTPELLARLREAGLELAFVTLEVGPGTFRPVKGEDPRLHRLDVERITVPPETAAAIARARSEGGRVVAVGTTVVRTLEHVAKEHDGMVVPYEGWTDLLILPGYRFRVVCALVTNFHLPRSSLLMLVCAFAGRDFVLEAYRRAVAERFRFYSFGDAMLILP